MIARCEAYRETPALTPEQAADLVLRVLVTHERQVGTTMARLVNVVYVLMPERMEQLLGFGHRAGEIAALSV